MPTRIAIIGYGKIAKDQHVPAITADPRFELVAVVSPDRDPDAPVASFASHQDMIAEMEGRLDAVAVCTPPGARHKTALDAITAGLHVLLEKPPAATVGEIEHLKALGRKSGRTLFTAWHAQHNAAVAAAAIALADAEVRAFEINWFEDVRKWHPEQGWIWAPGGFGVFDPGINALSIATRILPLPLFVREATLQFPSNKQAPIAASLTFAGADGPMRANMDWRHTDGEEWTIRVRTAEGLLLELLDGGSVLQVDGVCQQSGGPGEYPTVYDRFATLVASGQNEVDTEPLRIVADAFLVGRRELVEPFA